MPKDTYFTQKYTYWSKYLFLEGLHCRHEIIEEECSNWCLSACIHWKLTHWRTHRFNAEGLFYSAMINLYFPCLLFQFHNSFSDFLLLFLSTFLSSWQVRQSHSCCGCCLCSLLAAAAGNCSGMTPTPAMCEGSGNMAQSYHYHSTLGIKELYGVSKIFAIIFTIFGEGVLHIV